MQTAMRVLGTVLEERTPDAADVAELRRLAPHLQDAPLHDLACEVIQQELSKCRADAKLRGMDP